MEIVRPSQTVAERARDALALSSIALAAAALFAEALVLGQVQVERDTYLFYYPLYQWFAAALQSGHLPLWIPQLFGGYPLFADGEIGMLYPLHWFFFGLLPTPTAFVLLRVLHFVLAGSFMYAWVRALGLGRLPALLGGLTFAYSSFLVGQMHHENLLRTAIWLPLVLCWAELAYQNTGSRRGLYLLAGATTLSVQLTALHVQPALTTLLALGLYTAFRALWPHGDRPYWPAGWRERPHWVAQRLALGALVLGVMVGLGVGLAAMQLLPLYELGTQSFRGERVPFAFATSYAIHPTQLVTLVFPYFFRNDRVGSWQLWPGWETFIYVGIAPLVLALVAVAVVRRREVAFFGGLGVFGLLLAFGEYSPVPVLELLWPLPGFSALRVPGRYSLLVVVALAALAAYGLEWLETTSRPAAQAGPTVGRSRALLTVVVGVNSVVVALAILMTLARDSLLRLPEPAKTFIVSIYLAVNRMPDSLSPDVVYTGLVDSLALANRRTALGIVLLLMVGSLLASCYFAHRRARFWRTGLVMLTGVDLILWGRSFHPRESLAALLAPPPSVQYIQAQNDTLRRLWVSSPELRELEYNRPVTWGLAQAGGYSSLEPQREAEYAAVVAETPNTLLDLWGVRWIAVPARPPGLPSYQATGLYPGRPLMAAGAENPAADVQFTVPDVLATDVRLIAALAQSVTVPDGALLGEIIVTTTGGSIYSLPLIAGLHLSEWAYDRDDVRPQMQHRRAEVAFAETDQDSNGTAYPLYYYFSQHGLPEPSRVHSIRLRYTDGTGELRVFGMALGDDSTGQVYQIGPLDRAQYRQVYMDETVRLYENTTPFPRAFVTAGGVLPRPELGGLYSMYLDPFNPRAEVLLDNPPPTGTAPLRRMGQGHPPSGQIGAATIDTYDPERVVVQATTEVPGFLVLTDLYLPGWRVRVDGVETELLRGDYIFRAVPLAPGSHTVEFTFEPDSLRLGGFVSLLTLAVCAGAVMFLWSQRHPAGHSRH